MSLNIESPASTSLVARLGAALEASDIGYCQWKGHGKSARWLAGEGDIDLLVDRAWAAAFADLMDRLGFKLALAAPDLAIPGVVSYLGLEKSTGRLIHVHVHFKLIVGRAGTRHYHLPIESAVLGSSLQREYFRTPAPEFELILFVLQQTVKLDALAAPSGAAEYLASIQSELRRLERQAEPAAVVRALTEQFPDIGVAVFDRCLAALDPAGTFRRRVAARWLLAWRLTAYARGGSLRSLIGRAAKRVARAVGPNTTESGKSLATGGTLIALLGADGAGKSTAARALVQWLGTEIKTCHAHLGRPPRTVSTLVVGIAFRIGKALDRLLRRAHPSSLTAHLELLRHVCTARDRFVLFRRVRRFAAAGGIAMCERYPIRESYSLAGPSKAQGLALDAQSRLARGLRRYESWIYRRITPPDIAIVMRVEPEVAVARKTDEPADYVRARARRMWDTDWSTANAIVLDAGRDVAVVHDDLRERIWESL